MRMIVVAGIAVAVLALVAYVAADRSALLPPVPRAAPSGRGADPHGGSSAGRAAELERRVDRLTAALAAERAERRRLERRIDGLAQELAAVQEQGVELAPAEVGGSEVPPTGEPGAAPLALAADPAVDASPVERALVAAGLDRGAAADLKRRRDELTLEEMYLRDQATREGWVDTPHFRDELDAIERQRTSIRDEIGDDRYDRYLAALGEPNRVRVDEVLAASPAAEAGFHAGDVVVRYGDTRIFAPGDLVAETRSGTPGEPVRLEVIRDGRRIAIEVVRGPLGLRIAAARGEPG